MRLTLIILLIFLGVISCKEKYDFFPAPTQTSFLVVEGDIITNGTTKINISRTTVLEERKILFEKGAEVTIESDNNTTYSLIDKDSGRYELPFANLNENVKYRLNIKTRDNREYVSTFVQAIKTPVIDTITWIRYNEGIELYVNAKDTENGTQYYRFVYDETWEYKSPFKQRLRTTYSSDPTPHVTVSWYNPVTKAARDSITDCWRFANSTKILLGATTRLSEDKLYTPLVSYPRGAEQFAHLYSIRVTQYGISKEEYDFFQKMKKNTESLGTIFDAQPSELSGNFRCLTDTSETIIGYVGATRSREKRAFVDNKDLVGWNFQDACRDFYISDDPETHLLYFYEGNTKYLGIDRGLDLDKKPVISISDSKCIDCTLTGTNKKPSYWPR